MENNEKKEAKGTNSKVSGVIIFVLIALVVWAIIHSKKDKTEVEKSRTEVSRNYTPDGSLHSFDTTFIEINGKKTTKVAKYYDANGVLQFTDTTFTVIE